MKIISRYIRKMPANISCHQFCMGITRAINKHYTKKRMEELATHPEERMTASVVLFSRLRREIWMIGDCLCLLNGELLENPKPYEQTLAEMRAEKVKELLATGKTQEDILTNDEARAAIIPHMLQEMKNQNITYSVVDGFPIPEQLVPVLTLDFPLNIGDFKATKGFTPGNRSFDDRTYIRFTV